MHVPRRAKGRASRVAWGCSHVSPFARLTAVQPAGRWRAQRSGRPSSTSHVPAAEHLHPTPRQRSTLSAWRRPGAALPIPWMAVAYGCGRGDNSHVTDHACPFCGHHQCSCAPAELNSSPSPFASGDILGDLKRMAADHERSRADWLVPLAGSINIVPTKGVVTPTLLVSEADYAAMVGVLAERHRPKPAAPYVAPKPWVPDIKAAESVLRWLREEQPTCEKCIRLNGNAGPLASLDSAYAWDRDILGDASIGRCKACQRPSYPWASRLTAERILQWMLADPKRDHWDAEAIRRELVPE